MCFFKSPKAPPAPAPIVIEQPAAPPAPVPNTNTTIVKEVAETPTPQEQDPVVAEARNRERARQLRRSEANNTVVTGGSGLYGPASTGGKQLFGA